MSTTSAVNLGDTPAYREEMVARLGGRDRFEILESTADALARLIESRDERTLRTRPFEDKWTPMEILGHLVDAEILFALRTRTVLCDEDPRFVPIDQDRWAAGQRHNDRAALDLLAEFRALRSMNLRLWRSLTPEESERSAPHPQRGTESLDQMITMLAGHDLTHLDQMTRYLRAIEERDRSGGGA